MACGAGKHESRPQQSPLLRYLIRGHSSLGLEAALIQAEKLAIASRLAATIAHEINNPLEAITNLLYLASTGDDAAAAKSYAIQALAEVGRVSHITQQTLKFYRQSTLHLLCRSLRSWILFWCSTTESSLPITSQSIANIEKGRRSCAWQETLVRSLRTLSRTRSTR